MLTRAILAAGLAAFTLTLPRAEAGGLLFWDAGDLHDVHGRLRHIANPLRPIPDLEAPSGYVIGAFPDGGEFHVFLYARSGESWHIERTTTRDFKAYTEPQVVLRRPADARRWLTHRALARRPDTGEYLLLAWSRSTPGHGAQFFRSADGLSWEDLNPQTPAYTDQDACGLVWSPERGRWVVLQTTYQPWKRLYPDNLGVDVRRVLTTRTSADAKRWEPEDRIGLKGPYHPAERLVVPDRDDPEDLEFYNLRGFQYRDRYIGVMLNYAAIPQAAHPRREKGAHGPQLFAEWWVSREAMRSWSRPYREMFAGRMIPGAPAPYRDQLVWLMNGQAWGVPLDRIAGTWGLSNSRFTSAPFRMPATPLLLNAAALEEREGQRTAPGQAYIMVEVLDAAGKTVPGFEAERCVLRGVDGLRIPLRWEGRDTSSLAGADARLRFYFRDAVIHAVTWD